jgi:glycosyltransferase 2 family protein
MLRKRIFIGLQFLFFLGLGLFLVWWMLRGITNEQWATLKASMKNAKYWLLVPVFSLMFLSHFLRAVRWKMLMEPLGYKPSTFNVFNTVMIGYLANMAFPRLGEVLKCTILARYEKVAPDKLIGTIVAERAVDVICLLIVFVLTFAVQLDKIGSYGLQKLNENFAGKANFFQGNNLYITIGVALLAVVILFVLFRWLKQSRFVKGIKKIGAGILAGLLSIRQMKNRGLFIAYSAAIWFLYLFCTWLGFYALTETSGLGINAALAVLSFGSLGMIATPGGLGAYHFIVEQTLKLYGLTHIFAVGTSWILWSAQTVVILMGGLVCFLLLPFVNRNKAA